MIESQKDECCPVLLRNLLHCTNGVLRACWNVWVELWSFMDITFSAFRRKTSLTPLEMVFLRNHKKDGLSFHFSSNWPQTLQTHLNHIFHKCSNLLVNIVPIDPKFGSYVGTWSSDWTHSLNRCYVGSIEWKSWLIWLNHDVFFFFFNLSKPNDDCHIELCSYVCR